MKRLVPLAVLLLAAGCNNAINPVAPTPKPGTAAEDAAVAVVGPGGVCKLTSENTKITFVGTKPDGKHDGGFKTVEGSIKMLAMSPGQSPPADAAQITAITVEIDTDSLYSDDPTLKLTAHLKNPDFFDVKQFPKASFKSTKITGERGKDEDATVTGDLTLHGVTKSITFPVHFTQARGQFALTSSFKINRKDFGMTFGEGKVDYEVAISVTVGNPKDADPKK